jgi:hypothetical protein
MQQPFEGRDLTDRRTSAFVLPERSLRLEAHCSNDLGTGNAALNSRSSTLISAGRELTPGYSVNRPLLILHRRRKGQSLMADRQIEILEIGDPKIEDGMIELSVKAQSEGHEGRMRLRFSVEAAANMSARLGAVLKVAAQSAKRRK